MLCNISILAHLSTNPKLSVNVPSGKVTKNIFEPDPNSKNISAGKKWQKCPQMRSNLKQIDKAIFLKQKLIVYISRQTIFLNLLLGQKFASRNKTKGKNGQNC